MLEFICIASSKLFLFKKDIFFHLFGRTQQKFLFAFDPGDSPRFLYGISVRRIIAQRYDFFKIPLITLKAGFLWRLFRTRCGGHGSIRWVSQWEQLELPASPNGRIAPTRSVFRTHKPFSPIILETFSFGSRLKKCHGHRQGSQLSSNGTPTSQSQAWARSTHLWIPLCLRGRGSFFCLLREERRWAWIQRHPQHPHSQGAHWACGWNCQKTDFWKAPHGLRNEPLLAKRSPRWEDRNWKSDWKRWSQHSCKNARVHRPYAGRRV